MRYLILCLGAVLLTACATDPGEIKASVTDTGSFTSLSCPLLFADYQETSMKLTGLEEEQSRKRTGDTAGVFLVGLPVSSITSKDLAPEIADLKGRKDAIEQVSKDKKCTGH